MIALIAGIVFAAPFIMYQIWRLVAPALYLHQKKLAIPFILLTTGGFIGGALFNHFIVFHFMMAFFGSFSSGNLAFLPRLDDVFGLYVKMLFGMGLVFQMPAVVFFLAKMGLITPRFLWSNFKYAILIIFIIAAVVTPTPDIFNMMLFATPMCLLFFVGIFASHLLVLSREGRRFPWRITLTIVVFVLLLLAGLLFLAITKYGVKVVPHWPFFTH
jgi:sec-independent protein translocase protein TatC